MFYKISIKILALLNDKKGATAVEYGLIAAGISLTIAGAVFFFGDAMQALFETIADILNGG